MSGNSTGGRRKNWYKKPLDMVKIKDAVIVKKEQTYLGSIIR